MNGGLQELGEVEQGHSLLGADRVSVGKVKKFWRWTVVMIAQPRESINATELYI